MFHTWVILWGEIRYLWGLNCQKALISRISRKKASSRVGGELNEVAFKKEATI